MFFNRCQSHTFAHRPQEPLHRTKPSSSCQGRGRSGSVRNKLGCLWAAGMVAVAKVPGPLHAKMMLDMAGALRWLRVEKHLQTHPRWRRAQQHSRKYESTYEKVCITLYHGHFGTVHRGCWIQPDGTKNKTNGRQAVNTTDER